MKKIAIIGSIVALIVVGVLVAWGLGQRKPDEKYMMNASIAYGSVDEGSLDKTRVTYEIIISGEQQDIENIRYTSILVNKKYVDLVIDEESYLDEVKNEQQSYIQIEGKFIINTKGKNKQEIDDMELIQGVRIIDNKQNEIILELNH